MTTGQKIAERRKRLGLSQEKLGEQIGVTRQAISKWESDAALPEVEKLAQLSRIFGVTVGWLLGLEEAAENAQPVETQELTRHQLEMIEEIVKRYAAPSPKPQKKNTILAAACGVLAVWCIVLSLVLADWRNTAENGLANLNARLDSEVSELRGWISSGNVTDYEELYQQLEQRIEEAVGRGSVLASSNLTIQSFDYAKNTATVRLTAVPKLPELVNSREDLQFMAAVDGKTYTAGDGQWEEGSFHARIEVPAKDNTAYYLRLPTKDGVQQVCLTDEGDDVTMLERISQFSIEQLGLSELSIEAVKGGGSRLIWAMDNYGYLDIGSFSYEISVMSGENTAYRDFGAKLMLDICYNDRVLETVPMCYDGISGETPRGELDLPRSPKEGDTVVFRVRAYLSDGREAERQCGIGFAFNGTEWTEEEAAYQ